MAGWRAVVFSVSNESRGDCNVCVQMGRDMWALSWCCCGCKHPLCLRPLDLCWGCYCYSSPLMSMTAIIMWFPKKMMTCSWISIFIFSPCSNLTLNWASYLLLPKVLCTHPDMFLKKREKKMLFGTLITPLSESKVNQSDWHICIIEVNLLKKGNDMPNPSCTSRLIWVYPPKLQFKHICIKPCRSFWCYLISATDICAPTPMQWICFTLTALKSYMKKIQ